MPYARNYYTPYLKVYDIFREKIEAMKRQQGKIFIEDINRYLAEYLGSDIVPDAISGLARRSSISSSMNFRTHLRPMEKPQTPDREFSFTGRQPFYSG